MTDLELIEKKLAFIETCVRELRDLARPAAIATDVRLGEPDTNRQLFDLLVGAGLEKRVRRA